MDIREHDVPYHVRFAIDCDIRCGHWFTVRAKVGTESPSLENTATERQERKQTQRHLHNDVDWESVVSEPFPNALGHEGGSCCKRKGHGVMVGA